MAYRCFRHLDDRVLRGLMLLQLEGDMSLALAAAKHFLFELVLGRYCAPIPPDRFRSLLEGRAGFGFTFMVVFPIQCGADRALHRR
jgi:hypothetical protein